MNFEEQSKKVYDESVSLIADLGFRQRISFEEMNFLLSLLDMVFVHKNNPEFTAALRQWIRTYSGSEIDDIIKATLLAADFNDQKSLQQCVRAVVELMEHRT
jgi:hypothetical protein